MVKMGYKQNGSDRAEYGTATLKQLSAALKTSIGRGFSVDSLELMRRFYLTYGHLIPQTTMSETTSRIFAPEISEATSRISATLIKSIPALSQAVSGELLQQIKLSWSNYVILLTIDNHQERRFYEIEAAENSWSVPKVRSHAEHGNETNIRNNMDTLKSKGLLERIGPQRGGRWKLILPQKLTFTPCRPYGTNYVYMNKSRQ